MYVVWMVWIPYRFDCNCGDTVVFIPVFGIISILEHGGFVVMGVWILKSVLMTFHFAGDILILGFTSLHLVTVMAIARVRPD